MSIIDDFLKIYLEKIGNDFGTIKVYWDGIHPEIKYKCSGLNDTFSEKLNSSDRLDYALEMKANLVRGKLFKKGRNSVQKKEDDSWEIYIEPLKTNDENSADSEQLVLEI